MKTITLFNILISVKISTSFADENKGRQLRGKHTAQRQRSLYTPAFDFIKLMSANDECMEMSLATGNNVEMQPCDDEQRQMQTWHYDSSTNEIINKYDWKCLDVNTSDNDVLAWKCRGSDNQKWELLDSGMIKSAWNGKCLTMHSSNNLILSACRNNDNQKFKFTQDAGPNRNPPSEWKPMRSSTYDMVQCVESFDKGEDVSVTPCNFDEEMQNWRYDPQSNMILNKGNGMCLDIDKSNGNILVWSCHGRSNQQWYWDSNDKLRSRWNNKCVDIDEGSNGLRLSSCYQVQNQYFYL